MSLSLFEVEHGIQELMDMRDAAVDEGAPSDELAVIDKTIAEYFQKEVRNVNGIAHAITTYEAAAQIAKDEVERIQAHARRLQGRADRIRENALKAMQAFSVKKLETPTHRLSVCGNGGVEPLEVTNRHVLPPAFLKITVTLPYETWLSVIWKCEQYAGAESYTVDKLKKTEERYKPEPDAVAIREALKRREPCPECKGKGTAADYVGLEMRCVEAECPRCEGKGTIPNTVPGAQLLPRGEHLRVS